MEVGEGLQGRWNPFVRSKYNTNVCDQLSKLATNSDAWTGRSRRDYCRISQRMNKSRIGKNSAEFVTSPEVFVDTAETLPCKHWVRRLRKNAALTRYSMITPFDRTNWEISKLTKAALYAPFLTHSKQHSRFRFWHTKTAESWCPMKQNRTLKSNEESLKLHAKTSNNQLHLKILKHVAHFSFEKIKIHVQTKVKKLKS